jgi:RHS repeat-associated protein
MEYDVNNEAASVYDYGVQRNSYTNQRSGASQTQYYLYDGQGSVSSLTSIYGNPLVTYQYDAYGVAQVSGETYSPYQYNAEAVDTNTGLQYLRARYYNSNTGSFITQDTYTGTLEDPLTQNLYTYTGNNPINLADPSGHGWLRNAVSKVAGAARTVVRSVVNVATRVVHTVSRAVRSVVNTVSRAVRVVSRTVSNAVHSVVSTVRSVSSRVSTAATSFYQNTVTPAATAFASYLESQMEAPEPVDPVTAGLESRFGGAAVTKLTESFAYVGGKFVTALSEAEHKMCTTSKRIQTNITNAAKNIDWSKVAKTSLDVVQGGLDIVGLIPGVGEVADGVNAAIYLARGDTVNAALSAAACIPFAGWAATGGKVANKTIKAIDAANDIAKAVDTASDVVKAVDTAKDAAKLADNIGDSAKASRKLGYDLQFFAKNSDDVAKGAGKSVDDGNKLSYDLQFFAEKGDNVINGGNGIELPGRNGALNQAKRDAGIPRSQHPELVDNVPMRSAPYEGGHILKDTNGNVINTREYHYTNNSGQKIIIQEHSAGHAKGNQGSHFNVRPADNPRTGSVSGTEAHYPFIK